jgi:fucose 4-O-acetylase-like acetyltransferase
VALADSSTDAPAVASHAVRDRYVDAVRVVSLLVVIIGHWLMADVSPAGVVGNALVSAPSLQLVTWVLQVMPLFFLVGGVADAYALAALDSLGRTSPGRYATFVGSRAVRLLRPTVVLIAIWTGVGLLVRASGAIGTAEGPLMLVALRLVTQPLWFVGIYLGVAALAPAMLAAHRRWGAWVVVVLVLAALAVDGLRFTVGLTAVATLNYAFVWLALHQLGFCWYSGQLRVGVAVTLVVVGTMALVACVSLGQYLKGASSRFGRQAARRYSWMSPPRRRSAESGASWWAGP